MLKSKDPSNVQNYRLISIVPHLGKSFESMHKSCKQHGFRLVKSAITSNVTVTSYTSEVIENKGQMEVITTNFKKTFDMVDHYLLINIFKFLGIDNPLIFWLHCYIPGRKQIVKIINQIFELTEVPYDVSQGGHLSPFLFLSWLVL